jgi:signal peptidase I
MKRSPRWRLALAALAVAFLLRSVADLGRVAGGSMRPTLHDGDRILTNRLAYGWRLPFTGARVLRWSSPQRGDVVVLLSPLDGARLVKRVIGVPGDRIGGFLTPEARVPPGHYFVRGDGPRSLDSRSFGCVPRERILGRVVAVLSVHRILGTGGRASAPKNTALKNSRFVPYQNPRKFGSSAIRIALPVPTATTATLAEPASNLWFASET